MYMLLEPLNKELQMSPVNILVMIHGMTPDEKPKSPFDSSEDGKYWGYNAFWEALCQEQPELKHLFSQGFIGVEWGAELPQLPQPSVDELRQDQQLTRAQNFINNTISYNKLVESPDKNDVTIFEFPWLTPIPRMLVVGLRETIVIRGLGDVVYYCSTEGETLVRKTVYGQVLQQLDPYLEESEVRLHLIGQSLGVTLTHDFLYGLFTRKQDSDFLCQADKDDRERFEEWQKKATNRELRLGSLTSTASQLPLFMMRKQELVNQLAKEDPIDARAIGIVDSNKIQWQLFYDVDDLLAFGTRRLYNARNAIREYQVDSHDNPGDAHTSYWKNPMVITKTAELILRNAKAK